jgi:hypothetical protein
MKTLLVAGCSLGLLMGSCSAFAQDEEAPKPPPAKQGPDPGHLEIVVTSGEKVKTFEHPSKAIKDISQAVTRQKRAKEGEEPLFEAQMTLNDQRFTFTDPTEALEACKALTNAMRELPRLKMGLGDLGEIPEAAAEVPTQQPGTTTKPMGPRNQAAAMAEVRRRINLALQRQVVGTGSGGISIRYPSPAQMQQTINQEIEKARQEGLLPANTNAANVGAGFPGGDPREAKKEAIVQTLAFAFAKAEVAPVGGETPAGEEKPAEGDAPKTEEK